MKRGRLTSAIVAAISIPALGIGLGLTLGGAASARTISARQYSEHTVVINCQGQPQVRPGSFTLACADGNDYLSSLSWTSWTPGLASATGVQHETASPTARPAISAATRWTSCSGAAQPPPVARAASATPRSRCS